MAEHPIARPGRGLLAAHPVLVDVLLAIGYVLLLAVGMVHQMLFGDAPWLQALGLLVTVGIGGALLFRRRAPVIVLAVVFVLVMIKELALGLWDPLGIALACYAVGAYLPPKRAWIVLPATIAGVILSELPGNPMAPEFASARLPLMLDFVVPAGLLGIVVGFRRRLRESEWRRYQQLQDDRVRAAELSAAQNRTLLSREMHDVVGHSLTAIINVSDGAERAGRANPELLEEGLRRINAIARGALGETRSILTTLRSDDEPAPRSPSSPAPQTAAILSPAAVDPAMASPSETAPAASTASSADAADLGLRELVDTAESTGLAGRLVVDGSPVASRLTEEARRAVYRIVREAVTNVMRHAADATLLTVTVSHTPSTVTVQVLDDGDAPVSVQAGSGLHGIAERAAQIGADIRYGPAPAGGWHVTVAVPAARGGAS